MTDDPAGRRRSRRRATARQGPPRGDQAAADPEAQPALTEAPPTQPVAEAAGPPARTQPRAEGKQPRTEGRARRPAANAARGERDLAGSGSSQVGPTGAMRARDLNRPTPEDLAEAEAELTVVRRHWSPATQPAPSRPSRRRRS